MSDLLLMLVFLPMAAGPFGFWMGLRYPKARDTFVLAVAVLETMMVVSLWTSPVLELSLIHICVQSPGDGAHPFPQKAEGRRAAGVVPYRSEGGGYPSHPGQFYHPYPGHGDRLLKGKLSVRPCPG